MSQPATEPSGTADPGHSSSIDPSRLIIETVQDDLFVERKLDAKLHATIVLGDTFGNKYSIMKLLGRGAFSAVYLTRHVKTDQYSATKISKSGAQFKRAFEEEYLIMTDIQQAGGHGNIIELFDTFQFALDGNDYFCIVSEALGPNFESILRFSNQKFIPMENIRKIARQLLDALSFLHDDVGIIHADLKPENIMISIGKEDIEALTKTDARSFAVNLCDPDSNFKVKLGDFGVSMKPECCSSFKYVQTCHYRAPEAFLCRKFGFKIDIWSFGCVLYKLLTRFTLFPCGDDMDDRMTHLQIMTEVLGRISNKPFRKTLKPHCASYFGLDGFFKAKMTAKPSPTLNERVLSKSPEPDVTEFVDFLKCCLRFSPKKRLSAQEALRHSFITMEPFYPMAKETNNDDDENDEDETDSEEETSCDESTSGSSTNGTSTTSTSSSVSLLESSTDSSLLEFHNISLS
uniref:Protein kinase domain-containing protein n=1 Tax=Caenorhabditis tropicalis TaxID=1561998 RepID=A0A1I7TLA8_9PELO